MRFIISIAAALFFTATLAKQSDPFYLVLKSDNSTLDGKTLEACHEGAAIEGLCVSTPLSKASKAYNTYQFNYTSSTPNDGVLVWTLVSDNVKYSEGMELYIDPSTNVAIALFYPSEQFTDVSFDGNNLMYIKSYYNDKVVPPVEGKVSDLYRWHICEYNYEGYVYDVLCWVYGDAPPQNPSCQEVSVQRVYNK